MTAEQHEKIYNAFYGKVMGYIRARINRKAEAEDLCSDVFEKVYTRIDQYDKGKSSLSTWIFTITRNTVIDHYRRTKPTEELDENLSDNIELDADLLNQENMTELAAALRKLPQQLMDIIVLRYYDGLPLTEIGKKLGLSYGDKARVWNTRGDIVVDTLITKLRQQP